GARLRAVGAAVPRHVAFDLRGRPGYRDDAAVGGARLFPARDRALPRHGGAQHRRELRSDSPLWHARVRVGDRDQLHRHHAGQSGVHLVAADPAAMSGALYVCYSGLREPLVQTQVLPYLRELAAGGYRMSLVTFEPAPPTRADEEAWRERLRGDGIAW